MASSRISSRVIQTNENQTSIGRYPEYRDKDLQPSYSYVACHFTKEKSYMKHCKLV
jgi:hypothetical protein